MNSPDSSSRTRQGWARTAGICFGSAAALLTATAVVFVGGGLSVPFALGAVAVAVVLLGVAFFARSSSGH